MCSKDPLSLDAPPLKLKLILRLFQRNRLHHYVEYEDVQDINDALEKWETPPLNEMNKCVRDIWENMDTHKMNLLTVKNRLARHESTLLKIQYVVHYSD